MTYNLLVQIRNKVFVTAVAAAVIGQCIRKTFCAWNTVERLSLRVGFLRRENSFLL